MSESNIFSDGTLLQTVSTVVLALIGIGIRIWIKVGKESLTADQQTRLSDLAALAVGAAEELGSREDWTGPNKLSYAQEIIKKGFPSLDPAIAEAAIHSALAVVNIGNIGASDTRKQQPK